MYRHGKTMEERPFSDMLSESSGTQLSEAPVLRPAPFPGL